MASNVNANSGLIYKHCDKCGEPLYYGTSHICESSTDMVRKAIAARDKEWIAWAESQCPHGGIDSGGMICLECYQCWKDRKREVGQ